MRQLLHVMVHIKDAGLDIDGGIQLRIDACPTLDSRKRDVREGH